MTGVVLQEVLRILNCMSRRDFVECWGEMGGYLCDKYEAKDCDVFGFVCYLDPGNAQKLVNYAAKKMSPEILSWSEEQWTREQEAIDKLLNPGKDL